jgi:hypothetical protein
MPTPVERVLKLTENERANVLVDVIDVAQQYLDGLIIADELAARLIDQLALNKLFDQ